MNRFYNKEVNPANEFIVNFMFSGDYLDKNIGHEIINLYKSDTDEQYEGGNYVYLCQNGLFNPKEHGNIERIFMVRRTGNSGEIEILAFTDGDLRYIEPQYHTIVVDEDKSSKTKKIAVDAEEVKSICYGGVCVQDIFKNNEEQQDINVTFKAERIFRPKRPLIITLDTTEEGSNARIFNASRNLRTYIKKSSEPNNVSDKSYEYLNNVISSLTEDDVIEISTLGFDISDKESLGVTATEIYGIQDYELAYSNALKYFMDKYPQPFTELFQKHIESIGSSLKLGKYVRCLREWHNIDLVVEFSNAVIVIENKILSDLNGLRPDIDKDFTQLEKYYNIMYRKDERTEEAQINDKLSFLDKDKEKFFILLLPNHNDIILSDKHGSWHKVYYHDLYDVMKKYEQEISDINYSDFLHSIYQHSQTDYRYAIMRKRFIEAIVKAQNNRM